MSASPRPPVSVQTPSGLPTEGEILGRVGGENFRVASRLLPARARGHLLAFYGYARLVDQLGDEYDGDRLGALDWVSAELDSALEDPGAPGLHPLVARVATSVRALGADRRPLDDLVEANRVDQRVTSWSSWEDLLGYCALSANPVGRLVLVAFGQATPERVAWSDQVCTALQLAEHWQDVAEDARAGRIYLPADDRRRFAVDDDELAGRGPASTELRGLLAFEVARTREILVAGQPLVASLRGRARWAVAGFVAGGHAALDAVADAGYDPLAGAPRPTAASGPTAGSGPTAASGPTDPAAAPVPA